MEALLKTNSKDDILNAKNAIQKWLKLVKDKNTSKIHELLNAGTLVITKEEFERLKPESSSTEVSSENNLGSGVRMNYYFGVVEDKLNVYIVNSERDRVEDYSEMLCKPLELGIDISVLKDVEIDMSDNLKETREEFLERVRNWNLFSYNWIDAALKRDTSGNDDPNENYFFEGVSNPMPDLTREFKDTDVIYHTFGLHNDEKNSPTTVVYPDLKNYKMDLFCYFINPETGTGEYLEVSWPTFSKPGRNQESEFYKYNLFGK